jgi:hypothetical protein
MSSDDEIGDDIYGVFAEMFLEVTREYLCAEKSPAATSNDPCDLDSKKPETKPPRYQCYRSFSVSLADIFVSSSLLEKSS